MRKRAWASLVVLTVAVTAMQPVLAAPAGPRVAGSYTDQRIDWKPCFELGAVPPQLPRGSEALECGSYRVPRDWSAREAGVDLTIAVSRLPVPVAGSGLDDLAGVTDLVGSVLDTVAFLTEVVGPLPL